MTKPEDRTRDPHSEAIQKVGAAVVRDGKVIVVRKKGQPSPEWYMAGGKMEGDETQYQTLVRELREELGVEVIEHSYLGTFEDLAVFERRPIVLHAYYVRVAGEPVPAEEIREYNWIDADFEAQGLTVSTIMAKQVIPRLTDLGYL